MVEEDKEFTNKDPKFNSILDILIKKYEYLNSHNRGEVFAFIRLYIAIIIGFIPLYIGWSIEPIKNAFLTLWSPNLILRIIAILIMLTVFFLELICANWVLRRKSVENSVQNYLMINNFLDSDIKLNKLYLAKLNSEGWVIKIKQDEETGIFELIDILKQKSPSNNLISLCTKFAFHSNWKRYTNFIYPSILVTRNPRLYAQSPHVATPCRSPAPCNAAHNHSRPHPASVSVQDIHSQKVRKERNEDEWHDRIEYIGWRIPADRTERVQRQYRCSQHTDDRFHG